MAAMRVDGVRLLDWSMDADHNRSVVTIAGEPAAVVEAAVRGAGKAVELIDLTRQQGVHPRIGAADVIPFVPISGIKLEQCVLLARQAGLEIWRRFGVPVFFYEAAAARPDRANLEDVRRGQFEGLQGSGPQGSGSPPRPGRARPASHRRRLRRWRAQVSGGLQHLLRLGGCRHCPRHRPRDSRRFRRPQGRQGHGSARPWPRPALHEHHRLSGHAALPGPSSRLPPRAAPQGQLAEGEVIGLIPEAACERESDWMRQLNGFDPADQDPGASPRIAAALAGMGPEEPWN